MYCDAFGLNNDWLVWRVCMTEFIQGISIFSVRGDNQDKLMCQSSLLLTSPSASYGFNSPPPPRQILTPLVFSSALVHIKRSQELSCRQQIARQLRTQYAEGIYRHTYYTVTLKSRLRLTQGHWKWNHWIDHTRLSSSQVIWRQLNTMWPWNMG